MGAVEHTPRDISAELAAVCELSDDIRQLTKRMYREFESLWRLAAKHEAAVTALVEATDTQEMGHDGNSF